MGLRLGGFNCHNIKLEGANVRLPVSACLTELESAWWGKKLPFNQKPKPPTSHRCSILSLQSILISLSSQFIQFSFSVKRSVVFVELLTAEEEEEGRILPFLPCLSSFSFSIASVKSVSPLTRFQRRAGR